jgi:hypothetical protein
MNLIPFGKEFGLPRSHHIHHPPSVIGLEADIINLLRQTIGASDINLHMPVTVDMNMGGLMIIGQDREAKTKFAVHGDHDFS